MLFKAKNNREAVVVCAIHVVKRPSKRSVLVHVKENSDTAPQLQSKVLFISLLTLIEGIQWLI